MAREERGDRGLGWYLDEQDAYKVARIELSDSSSAEGAHCWLRLSEPRREHLGEKIGGTTAAHLDFDRATRLRDALNEWLARNGGSTDRHAVAEDLNLVVRGTEDQGDPEDLRRAVRRLAFVVAFLADVDTDGEVFWVPDEPGAPDPRSGA